MRKVEKVEKAAGLPRLGEERKRARKRKRNERMSVLDRPQPQDIYPHGFVSGSSRPASQGVTHPGISLAQARLTSEFSWDPKPHWIDLTRLLSHTFEELEEGNRSSGKWTISFKLTGKAKSAILNTSGGGGSSGGGSDNGRFRRLGSVPSNSNRGSHLLSWSSDIKVLNDLDEGHFGDLEDFNFYYEHLEPHKPSGGSSLESGGESSENVSNDTEFSLIKQGIEYSTNDTVKPEDVVDSVDGSEIKTIDVTEIFKGDEEMESNLKGTLKDDYEVDEENYVCTQESTIEEHRTRPKSPIHSQQR
ncbi:hypothetical protein LguiA_030337 [Lonicera macranthoides]